MKKWNIEKIIGIAMLIFAIGFNLWLYRLEPTATIDPNDNTFQFGLVDRANTIWTFANKKCFGQRPISLWLTSPICHFSYMSDHWVHNWAEGYNLPYYYSHIPQIAIVGSYRFFHSLFATGYSLFAYYHLVIYLLLCLIPLPVFLSLRIIGLPWLTAGLGALLATHLSTDGLYGLDPSSFLWRGYGLSSQLFAMIWLPLALAYAFRFFKADVSRIDPPNQRGSYRVSWKNSFIHNTQYTIHNTDFLLAVVFTTATTAGHLGIGMITMISLGFMAISKPCIMLLRQEPLNDIVEAGKEQLLRLSLVAGISIFLLSYWIVPTFLHDNFHNISFWDPVWKFDSYGWKETIIRLLNGDLFDFGRLPYITILTLVGVFVGLSRSIVYSVSSIQYKKEEKIIKPNTQFTIHDTQYSIHNTLYPFSFLFLFWLLMYFGRTTWGGLIDLIPGMKEFHLSRFLVGLHVTGMLLAPIGFEYLVSRIVYFVSEFKKIRQIYAIRYTVYGILIILLLPPIYKWTLTYNELNNKLIIQANANHAKVKQDEAKLFAKLRSLPPGRIFAGRGGGFGKKFEVAETPYFMHLSTYGLPTTLWLPETWSMNSDTEQYFSENLQKDYDLYNMRWVAAPPDQEAQPFWKLVDQSPTWKLYEVPTTGYFTTGVRPAIVSSDKRSFINIEHLWIQSDMTKNRLFPELTFDKDYPKPTGLPNFRMLDEANYKTPDGKTYNIWSNPPVYLPLGVTSIDQFKNMNVEDYNKMKLIGPEVDDTDMIFKTKVEVAKDCIECMVILKQTYHPGWKAWVDGHRVTPIIVFPFFIGIPVTEGTHDIVAAYEPSSLKVGLLVLTLLSVTGSAYFALKQKRLKP